MSDELQGRVALVTGGGRGIGRAVALSLGARGASVVVNDIGSQLDGSGTDRSVADVVVDELSIAGTKAIANSDSIASFDGARKVIEAATSNFGRLDILVNCAGVSIEALPWEMSEEQWTTTISTHLTGHFACARAASFPMREQRSGRIVNITSHVGLVVGTPTSPNYCAAKAGVVGLTKSLALALAPYGVTVNAVAPSAVTRMSDTVPVEALRQRAAAAGFELPAEMTEEQIRMALIGDPAAVANFITYLSTDSAASITGHAFAVIGGHIGVFGPVDEARTIDKAGVWDVDELVGAVPGLIEGVSTPCRRNWPTRRRLGGVPCAISSDRSPR
jgi:NAD(P)-dependent dehydrogenase (short-subunit alcohol dehydrogenase family)